MKQPKFTTEDGYPTTRDDPERALFVSAMCSYWTDDWNKIATFGPGIPCCPFCHSPGFQTTGAKWDAHNKHNEEVAGFPRYAEFTNFTKEQCGKVKPMDQYRAWLKEQEG